MGARAGLVAIIVGGLLLHAYGARAGENVLEPPHSVTDQAQPPEAVRPIPSGSDAPNSVVDLSPLEPAVSRPLTEPRTIHKVWTGLAIAGGAIVIPSYLLQMLMTLGYSPTIQTYDQPCSYCAKAQAL